MLQKIELNNKFMKKESELKKALQTMIDLEKELLLKIKYLT